MLQVTEHKRKNKYQSFSFTNKFTSDCLKNNIKMTYLNRYGNETSN